MNKLKKRWANGYHSTVKQVSSGSLYCCVKFEFNDFISYYTKTIVSEDGLSAYVRYY